jgi:hypothetical protein
VPSDGCVPGTGPGSGSGAFGPEASDAFIDWLDDQVVVGEGDLASPYTIGESFRYRLSFSDLDVELDGFAGCLVGGVLDLVGVARVRQDLNHKRARR